jgi:hypothetical protein
LEPVFNGGFTFGKQVCEDEIWISCVGQHGWAFPLMNVTQTDHRIQMMGTRTAKNKPEYKKIPHLPTHSNYPTGISLNGIQLALLLGIVLA